MAHCLEAIIFNGQFQNYVVDFECSNSIPCYTLLILVACFIITLKLFTKIIFKKVQIRQEMLDKKSATKLSVRFDLDDLDTYSSENILTTPRKQN